MTILTSAAWAESAAAVQKHTRSFLSQLCVALPGWREGPDHCCIQFFLPVSSPPPSAFALTHCCARRWCDTQEAFGAAPRASIYRAQARLERPPAPRPQRPCKGSAPPAAHTPTPLTMAKNSKLLGVRPTDQLEFSFPDQQRSPAAPTQLSNYQQTLAFCQSRISHLDSSAAAPRAKTRISQ